MSSVLTQPSPLSKEQVKKINPQQVHDVLKRTMLVDGFDVVYDLDKSRGMFLYDSRENKEYMDFFSMFASWPISHNHPRLKDPAFLKKLAHVALHNPANSDIYTVEMAQFVATFERVAMPPGFKHVFFVQGGSQAVENSLKTAMDWKVQKNLKKGLGERGNKVLHYKEAFHGRGGYTMSLTNTSDPNKYKYFALFKDWPRVSNPKALFPLTGKNLEQTVKAEQKSLGELKSILDKHAVDVCAIILEPVQGEGGDNHFRPEYWQALRKIADQYDVLLIADEVQCGFGLSGKFWTWQHLGAQPDLVVFGKKSQVCGFMANSRVDDIDTNVFKVSSRINSTWGGNLVDMVRSQQFLEIIEEDNLVENSAVVGAHLLQSLEELQKQFPKLIYNARGRGLLCAFDTVTPEITSKIKTLGYQRGMLLISCGTQTIRFRPFLDSTKEQISKAVSILRDVLTAIDQQSKKSAL